MTFFYFKVAFFFLGKQIARSTFFSQNNIKSFLERQILSMLVGAGFSLGNFILEVRIEFIMGSSIKYARPEGEEGSS